MSARLMIIGLDGADGRLLDRASRDGTLPNLTGLRARGHAWPLSSPAGATDDALWASFQYGTDVGEHGRYHFLIDAESGSPSFAVLSELDRETFWDELSRQGRRVAILDIPKCRPPRALNGIHLADWLVHGRYFPAPLTYPEALAGDIVTRFGAPPPSRCDYQAPAFSDDDVRSLRDNLLRSVGQKRAAGLHVLSAETWDLFAIGFKESHCCCHMLWEFTDPGHARHDAMRVARLGNPVLDVLKAQDVAIGELVAAAGPAADVVVFSTTDYRPNGSILHLLPEILERVNRYIGMPVGERFQRTLFRQCGLSAPPMNCRSVPYGDNAAALRVRPRRGEDMVRYTERVDMIAALACELVDVDDRVPVVSAVTRPAFEQAGSRAAELPHLLLHFRANICPRAIQSERLGRIEAPRPDDIRSGNHEAGGFAIAAGPAAVAAAAGIKSMQDFASLARQILGPGAPAQL